MGNRYASCPKCAGRKKLQSIVCRKCAGQRFVTHGKSNDRMYHSWRSMISRITNPKHDHYACYGGRGLDMDPRWKKFDNFLADMGEPSSPKMSIGRIDNSRGYWPDNCRWENQVQQMNNRRGNHMIEWRGKVQSLVLWARERGIPPAALYARITKLKWGIEDALTRPPRPDSRRSSKEIAQ